LTFEQFAILATALGIGPILDRLVQKIIGRRTGRMEKEQTAWQQRDAEARRRRVLEEALHEHRQCWHIQDGRRYDDMPPWPSRPSK